MAGVMLVDVATAAVAVLVLAVVHVPQPAPGAAAEAAAGGWWAATRAGFGYLWQRPGHIGLLTMAAVVNLCLIPAFSLLPLFVTEHLGGSAMQLGTLNSSFGLGMMGGGILLGVWGGFERRIVTALTGLIAMGVSICALGLVPAGQFPLALAAMGLIGAASTFTNGPIQAILQATIAPEFQGRVFTIYGSLSTLAAPIGLVLAAPIAAWLGVARWFLAGGVICVAMAAAALGVRSIRHIERGPAAMQRARSVPES
jgi:DHA3 family macrolide efflux protein-like MFS transporter